MSNNQAALQALLDKEAIREVLLRYCRAIDRCDEGLLRSVYHADASEEHGWFNGSSWESIPSRIERMRSGDQRPMHCLCNILIELDGDTAHSEAYFLACRRVHGEDEATDLLFAGRYLDRLERRGGEWRIAHRIVVHEFDRADPVRGRHPVAKHRFVESHRSRQDPLYLLG